MDEYKSQLNYSQYICVSDPSDINISQDQIFFREKYQEIINYLKIMMINDDDEIVKQYIYPKGALLINIGYGTDINDFFRLIAKNYNINFVEFNYEIILRDLNKFYDNLNEIIEWTLIERNPEDRKQNDSTDRNKVKNLIIFEQSEDLTLKNHDLMKGFLSHFLKKPINYSFLDQGSFFIWINHNLPEIHDNSTNIFELFDLFIRISTLKKDERLSFLSTISEKYPKIVFEINSLAEITNNWEVKDLEQLLKLAIFKQYLNSDLNDVSNEITHILQELIDSEEFIPTTKSLNLNENSRMVNELPKLKTNKNEQVFVNEFIDDLMLKVKKEGGSQFLLSQFYEDAASQNYAELMIILEKLKKRETLEPNELQLLAKYNFILQDDPNKAQITLEKAKKRIEQIKQAFGI
jgi:hypothetical protein